MTVAAIDIGSNAIRMIVAREIGEGHFEVLQKYRAAVRLGGDVFTQGKISNKTVHKTLRTFLAIQKLLIKYEVRRYRAVATSAFRDASNKDELLKIIHRQTGIKIEVIDGKEEAQLIFSAVRREINITPYCVLLIDIGGGSTELTFAKKGKTLATQSFSLGTVRLLSLLKQKRKGETELPFLLMNSAPQIQKFVTSHVDSKSPLFYAIGTGGNLEAMGKLKAQLLKKHPSSYLTLGEIESLIERISKLTLKQRVAKLKLRPDRADVIVPAMLIIKLIMLQAGVEKIVIPYVGLKEGLLHSLGGPLKFESLKPHHQVQALTK